MELPDRDHKHVSGDWLKEVGQVFKVRAGVRQNRRVRSDRPIWGNRMVRYL